MEKIAATDKDPANDEAAQENGSVLRSYFRVFAFADTVSWTLNVIAFVCAVAAGALLPLMDLIFGKFVTVFNDFTTGKKTPQEFRSDLRWWTLWFVYLFIGKFVLTYIWTTVISVAAIRTTKALRIKFLESTLRQNIAFFDRSDAGSIAIQVTTNGNLVTNGISEKLGLAIQGCSTFITAFAVAFAVQWKLTLITACVVPIILTVTFIGVVVDAKQEAEILKIHSQAGTLAQELYSSMKTVQAFWAQPRFIEKFETFLKEAGRIGAKKSPNYGILFSTEYFCIFAGYGLAFWQGVRRYADGEISQPGTIVTVILAVVLSATSLTQLMPASINIAKAASAADELFRTIDREPDTDVFSDTGLSPTSCEGDIEISDVHFAYPSRPTAPVLKGMSLRIPANKTTALVGASGCGKSTIVGLLDRWYNPARGSLRLDGVEVGELNLKWLRSKIRVVQQEPSLFRGSVYDNVIYGLEGTELMKLSPNEKMKLVEQACMDAYAHDFVMALPKGYRSVLGERALTLSGGQKQRLAIARSIISQPQILLLDEATSGLDAKSERIVQDALDRVSANRTTLIIAHRLSTVRKADNIAVMSDGAVIEQGTHEELIALNGAYARLVNAQELGERIGGRHILEDDHDTKPINVTKTETSMAGFRDVEQADASVKKSRHDRNLVSCLAILLGEQKKIWPYFILVAALCIVGGLTYPAQAIVFSRVMGCFALPTHQMVDRGNFLALMFFVIALANLVIFFIVGWLANVLSQALIYAFRLELFTGFLRQDMVFFDDPENSPGALVSKLSSYPTQLQELFSFNFTMILIVAVNLVSSSILALAVGWKLGLVVVFGALPPIIFSGYLRIRLELSLDEATFQRFADSAALASEAVGAIRTVASLTLERYILDTYRKSLIAIEQKSIKSLVWIMFWYSLTQSSSFLAMALGFWYGGTLMSYGEYSTTQFFIVFIAVIFAGEASAQLFAFTTSFTKAQSAANYLLNLRDSHPSITENQNQKRDNEGSSIPAQLTCNNLEFAYPTTSDRPVLRGICINIEPGQTTAIVGPSGSGKTSIVSLLERFYDPSSGSIRLDNHDISNICPRQYRAQLGLVQQEPTLFSGSIRENISLGLESDHSEASDEQVEAACRDANIFDFVVSLPEGFNTLCGTNGAQLSGGQKQRIAIARALIRKPRLLLLDEATSALDTASERVVQAALERAAEGRTTVAIAHRLSTIKHAEKIVVVSKGEIVEVGNHEELLAKQGLYYEMCLAQALDG